MTFLKRYEYGVYLLSIAVCSVCTSANEMKREPKIRLCLLIGEEYSKQMYLSIGMKNGTLPHHTNPNLSLPQPKTAPQLSW
jgi:hypothetical protein